MCERKGREGLLCGFARMGKYRRKRKRSVGRTPAVDLGLGVRTRARSASVASASASATAAAADAPAPKRPRKQATARAETEAEVAVRGNAGGPAPAGCCYLQLRSRRLFMPAGREVHCPVPPFPAAAVQRFGASREAVEVGAGISRCSSTASLVDVVLAAAAPAAGERSGGEAEEVGAGALALSQCQNTIHTWRR